VSDGADMAALVNENARLRVALEDIASGVFSAEGSEKLARMALAGKTGTDSIAASFNPSNIKESKP
jgi:hypothetical protein